MAVLAGMVGVVDAEVAEASGSAVCAGRVVPFVDGPSGLLALIEELLAALLGVEFGGRRTANRASGITRPNMLWPL